MCKKDCKCGKNCICQNNNRNCKCGKECSCKQEYPYADIDVEVVFDAVLPDAIPFEFKRMQG